MNLKDMTEKGLLFFDVEWGTKEEVISNLVDALDQNGYLNSKEEYFKAVMEREDISPTGFEAGLAIPHGKSTAVKKAAFAVARLKNKMAGWESIDPNNQVELVFLLAIPGAEAGSTHLSLLSELSTRLMDQNYYQRLMNAKNAEQFLSAIDQVEEKAADSQEYTKTVVAITACAAGIAHTYMAAEALEKAGREMGVRVLTEKQGANGLEDQHTKALIQEADAVIFATDISPKGKERFNGKPYVQTKVAEPLKSAKEMINRALNNPDGVVQATGEDGDGMDSGDKKGIWAEMSQAILTGISYMIPVIVAAGLMIGIAKLGAMPFGLAAEIQDPKYIGQIGRASCRERV